MGEIGIGILVMVVFIGFVVWKNKGKPKRAQTMQDRMNEQWWAEKEQERKEGPVIVSADNGDDSDSDD
jgi:hypothetical protein